MRWTCRRLGCIIEATGSWPGGCRRRCDNGRRSIPEIPRLRRPARGRVPHARLVADDVHPGAGVHLRRRLVRGGAGADVPGSPRALQPGRALAAVRRADGVLRGGARVVRLPAALPRMDGGGGGGPRRTEVPAARQRADQCPSARGGPPGRVAGDGGGAGRAGGEGPSGVPAAPGGGHAAGAMAGGGGRRGAPRVVPVGGAGLRPLRQCPPAAHLPRQEHRGPRTSPHHGGHARRHTPQQGVGPRGHRPHPGRAVGRGRGESVLPVCRRR